MVQTWWPVLHALVSELEGAGIAYMVVEESALWAQGVEGIELERLTVEIQWDQFTDARRLFATDEAQEDSGKGWSSLSFTRDGVPTTILCRYNTVILTNIDRWSIVHEGQKLYVKSFDFYRRTWGSADPRTLLIAKFLRNLQREHSQINAEAWNQSTYDAWVHRYGSPAEAAAWIKKDPEARLAPLNEQLGDLHGKKTVNLLGSHGAKGIAMALLGADAAVMDISRENAAYAQDVAREAGVALRYVVSDVLDLPAEELTGDYDVVLMELGILHYFIDLLPLGHVVRDLLKPGGRFVLHDFHPISTKLITSKGKKHKVTGNYFESGFEEADVAYSKHFPDGRELKKVRHRKWTLGEIVTAFAQAGLAITSLSEEPNTKIDDIGLPKTFTLVAQKA
ncbi:class I SAM-dependent methyltransferase [Tumebacillus permanentifrigoris]|uniref:Methyltransferase family protein n=1 Tax=Tumebacillus permanentifrigoris TaxID=378543 RepID=A0A316DCU4_9BACL|nr:class I SAM-dependent methyltransferase [Tumebacillus permanentifrigoris]PWK15814.1 methyltransferase family protein [Tumebacillus permanentifrigoris]